MGGWSVDHKAFTGCGSSLFKVRVWWRVQLKLQWSLAIECGGWWNENRFGRRQFTNNISANGASLLTWAKEHHCQNRRGITTNMEGASPPKWNAIDGGHPIAEVRRSSVYSDTSLYSSLSPSIHLSRHKPRVSETVTFTKDRSLFRSVYLTWRSRHKGWSRKVRYSFVSVPSTPLDVPHAYAPT